MAGMKSPTPTIYVSVERFVVILCFVELTIGNPRLKDKPPLEYTRILGCNAKDSSTLHFEISLQLALRVSEILLVPMKYCIIWTN